MISDPVRLAVLTNRLQAIVHKMMNTLHRTGRSGVINTARDFSCCILTRDHELLMPADSIPIHVMCGPDLISRAIAELHPEPRRGDAFLHNSPYHGNSHAADHCLVVPVVDEKGEHHFTVLAKAHQADCGNSVPTTYMGTARDVYEEGALIFPAVKIQENYRSREDIVRMCRMRIRVPEQWSGDFLAALGAARIGERELLELGTEVGWDVLHQHVSEWFDYSEQRMIAALRKLPSARVEATSVHDPFPGVPDGIPITAAVEVESDAARITVDLRDNPDAVPCGLNLTEATARTAAMIGIFNSIDATVPPNGGSFRRITVHLRENCVAGIPVHPTSCSVATTNVADRVANSVQRALAELGDGHGMAEAGSIIPPAIGVISGRRRDGQPFVNQVTFALTGGPGGPSTDGWLTLCHVGNAGVLFHDSIEVDESQYPIRVEAQYLIPDSEGAGRHRGAPGCFIEFGPTESTLESMYASDGVVHPALGAHGGLPGAAASQHKRHRDGALHPVDPSGPVLLEPGETIISMTCGGGGYGPPWEREPGRVRDDVVEGLISRQRASTVYGVVIDGVGQIDASATMRLRAALA